jgi:hypothetical protein
MVSTARRIRPSALPVTPLRRGPSAALRARCPGCVTPLVVHQPDEELACRLLGTCRRCKAWFLIDAAAGAMLHLPAGADDREA